jgi:hypothetical protein
MTLLIATGFYWSGMTLLQKMLDAHPLLLVVYQPAFPVFKIIEPIYYKIFESMEIRASNIETRIESLASLFSIKQPGDGRVYPTDAFVHQLRKMLSAEFGNIRGWTAEQVTGPKRT